MPRATDMLHRARPAEAYRRVEIDAFIAGGQAAQLTRLCLAETISALNRALYFDSKGEAQQRGACVAKAVSSIQALTLSVDRAAALGEALLVVYGDAITRIMRNQRAFDSGAIEAIRTDFLELEQAFAQSLH